MRYPFKGFKATRPVVLPLSADKGTFYVYFDVYPPLGKKKPYRFQKDMNLESSRGKRYDAAKAAADIFWEALQNGWNPLVQKYPSFQKHEDELRQLTFCAALQHCLKVKKPGIAIGTYWNYKSTVKYISKAANAEGYGSTPVNLIERKDIRLIIARAKEDNNWKARERNKHLTVLKDFMGILIDEERIKFNPADGIRNETAEQTAPYKRLTDDEKERLARFLLEKAPAYFELLMFVYQAGIRPKELLLLRVNDINLLRREILVRPEVAKTNRSRIVPLADDLMDILIGRNITQLQPNWFLFSKDEFKPGPKPYYRSAAGRWWRNMVIKELGIDCKMYSLKHRGADDKILAGIPLDVLKELYGHSSEQMTRRYAEAIMDKNRQHIINNSPSFAKVIPMKKAK